MREEPSKRQYERVRVCGAVRMMVDTPDGLCTTTGELIDLCEGGCAIFTRTPLEPQAAARVQVEVGGVQIWLPIVTRWVRRDARGWTVGCSFDRPTDEKERAIRSFVWRRRHLVNS